MYLYFVTSCCKHYSLRLNRSAHSVNIMLSSVACISYLSYCCDQIPNKKKIRGGVIYFGLQFQGMQLIMEWEIKQQG